MINETILYYIKEKKQYTKSSTKQIRLLLLCNPCHGFGDVVFAMKLKAYIKKWYDCLVHIGTSTPEQFLKLGVDKKDIIALKGGRQNQCRRFATLKPEKPIGNYDLIFVAPLQMDNKILQSDITKLIPYADKKNTFFFSEYNDDLNKGFDFNTGIGRGRDGIFLTDVPKKKHVFSKLGKYGVAYLAQGIDNSDHCFLSFLELLTTKYKLETFSIVAPQWVADISDNRFLLKTNKHYDKIVIQTKTEKFVILDKGKNVLHIRCDIFPLTNSKMLSLMTESVDDILLTGDQSLTDGMSCCSSKNIFYQIVPWKEDFAKNLATLLPNHYLAKKRTSCGTIQAVNYKSNYKAFIKKWDFRTKGKVKLDAIMAYAVDKKEGKE